MKKRVWLAIVGVVVLCIGICYYMFLGRYSWSLSDDGKLTIPGLDRPDYLDACPWLAQSGKIKEVVIKDGVTSIGDYAFYECSSLRSITIPNSVTSIGDNAFSGCSCLRSITIPNSVTGIGHEVFEGCSNLRSITIPNSVTSIGDNAFSGCSCLRSITIPNSVTGIGHEVFEGCSNLRSITCTARIPPNRNCTRLGFFYPFFGLEESIPVYVPAESVEAYKKAEGWKEFYNIKAIK